MRRMRLLQTTAGIVLAMGLVRCGEESAPLPPKLSDNEALSACPTFCTLAMRHCQHEMRPYDTIDACQMACSQFRALGTPGETSGDTLACRMSFALLARSSNRIVFCLNTTAKGGSACREPQ